MADGGLPTSFGPRMMLSTVSIGPGDAAGLAACLAEIQGTNDKTSVATMSCLRMSGTERNPAGSISV
jgi:hypothetical protein